MAQINITVKVTDEEGVSVEYTVVPEDPSNVDERELTTATCFARMFENYLTEIPQEELVSKVEAAYKELLEERIKEASDKATEDYKDASSGS